MRSRVLLFASIVAVSALVLPSFAYAAIPFFGPIIPTGYTATCAAGWGMLIVVINNIISLAITIGIIFIAPLVLAYAGFLLVFSPANEGNRQKAKGVILNVVIGIVIALAAWLIVDAIMAVLTPNGKPFGENWASIISSNGAQECLSVTGATTSTPSPNTPGVVAAPTPTAGAPTAAGQYLSFGTGAACNGASVQTAAAAGQYSLTTAQANTLACIASYESTCGTNLQNSNWGSGSSAYGAFQVLLQNHSNCYDNPACEQAAGTPGTPLNCAAGFSNGNPKTDPTSQAIVDRCTNAAKSLPCSASAAACLVATNPSFSDWSSSGDQTCISKYNN